MSILSQVLSGTSNQPATTLRDYQHASKIFRPNNSSFLPKSKNWFHIFFELDPVVISAVNAVLGEATSNFRINWNPTNVPILGILAKTAKLPTFKFDVKKNNQYNRWSLTTTKITYDPIEISFWDDTVDTIRGFWYAYYQYMIQDPRYVNFQASQNQGIAVPYQWAPSTANVEMLYSTSSNWGVNYGMDTVDTLGSAMNKTNPFFRSIRIYQFNRQTNSDPTIGPQYTEYVLVNPVISSFDHDTVDFSSSEYMQNKMSIECETVLYNSGLVNNDEIASWDAVLQTFFDTTPSFIAPVNTNLNQVSQLGSSVNSSLFNAPSVSNGGTNSGINSVTSILNQPNGDATTVQNSSIGLLNNKIGVPNIVPGFGNSGLPPDVLGA